MSFAARVDQDLDRRYHEFLREHDAGDHADEPEPDCTRCVREAREARDDQPEFHGAFG